MTERMLLLVVTAEGVFSPEVFMAKAFRERQFHLPRKAINHPNEALAAAGDIISDVFEKELPVGAVLYVIPNCTDRGLPVMAARVAFRGSEIPKQRRGFSTWDWMSARDIVDGTAWNIAPESREVVRHMFPSTASPKKREDLSHRPAA